MCQNSYHPSQTCAEISDDSNILNFHHGPADDNSSAFLLHQPIPLKRIALRAAALAPLASARFTSSIDNQSCVSVQLESRYLHQPFLNRFAHISRFSESLRHAYRCCFHEVMTEILRWGYKHEQVIFLAHHLNYGIRVRQLLWKGSRICDRGTAMAISCGIDDAGRFDPVHTNVPEEIRFCFAAFYTIDDYFTLQRRRMASFTSPHVESLISKLKVLWLDGGVSMPPGEVKRWFRKLCHKGITELAYHIWTQQGSSFHEGMEDSSRMTLLLYFLTEGNDELADIIQGNIPREKLSSVFAPMLGRYFYRPAMFQTALKLVAENSTRQELALAFSKINPSVIIRAARSFNIPFMRAILDICGPESIAACRDQIAAIVRQRAPSAIQHHPRIDLSEAVGGIQLTTHPINPATNPLLSSLQTVPPATDPVYSSASSTPGGSLAVPSSTPGRSTVAQTLGVPASLDPISSSSSSFITTGLPHVTTESPCDDLQRVVDILQLLDPELWMQILAEDRYALYRAAVGDAAASAAATTFSSKEQHLQTQPPIDGSHPNTLASPAPLPPLCCDTCALILLQSAVTGDAAAARLKDLHGYCRYGLDVSDQPFKIDNQPQTTVQNGEQSTAENIMRVQHNMQHHSGDVYQNRVRDMVASPSAGIFALRPLLIAATTLQNDPIVIVSLAQCLPKDLWDTLVTGVIQPPANAAVMYPTNTTAAVISSNGISSISASRCPSPPDSATHPGSDSSVSNGLPLPVSMNGCEPTYAAAVNGSANPPTNKAKPPNNRRQFNNTTSRTTTENNGISDGNRVHTGLGGAQRRRSDKEEQEQLARPGVVAKECLLDPRLDLIQNGGAISDQGAGMNGYHSECENGHHDINGMGNQRNNNNMLCYNNPNLNNRATPSVHQGPGSTALTKRTNGSIPVATTTSKHSDQQVAQHFPPRPPPTNGYHHPQAAVATSVAAAQIQSNAMIVATIESARRGYIAILDAYRTSLSPPKWDLLLTVLLEANKPPHLYPQDVVSYLYFEARLRPLLEQDWSANKLDADIDAATHRLQLNGIN